MIKKLIITDLDNTIYNWVDYFAPSFRAMVHVISKMQKIDEDLIYEDFKNVYTIHKSLEYSYSIQELSICKNMDEQEINGLIKAAKGAFSRVRQKHLSPYYSVKETLKWAFQEGILIVAVTNAPMFHAIRRLRQLRIDNFFTGVAGALDPDIPENGEYTKKIIEKKQSGKYKTNIKMLWELSEKDVKPNPISYLQIINDIGASHKNTYVIGDSLYKDILPAQEIGAIGIWAKYGITFEEKNFKTLLKISPWDQEKIETVYDNKSAKADFSISSFMEIKNIIETPQMNLF